MIGTRFAIWPSVNIVARSADLARTRLSNLQHDLTARVPLLARLVCLAGELEGKNLADSGPKPSRIGELPEKLKIGRDVFHEDEFRLLGRPEPTCDSLHRTQ